jgi:two-component system KDP operon response regulator KdpE
VVVAEDDPEMQRLMMEELISDGHRVIGATNGIELIDLLRGFHDTSTEPTVLVTDLWMPGLNGLDIIRMIRAWGWCVPVILLSAFPDHETLSKANAAGVTTFLAKPFGLEDLRAMVGKLGGRGLCQGREVSTPREPETGSQDIAPSASQSSLVVDRQRGSA